MEWLFYLLKVSACTALFYIFYHFFLQKLTFFSANRIFLILTLLIAFGLPAAKLEIEIVKPTIQDYGVAGAILQSNQVARPMTLFELGPDTGRVLPDTIERYSWEKIFTVGYWMVSFTMLSIFLFQLGYMLICARKVDKRVGKLKLVFKPRGFTNCSFFNYVFVANGNLTENEFTVFLKHESEHVARYHSFDKLLVAGCKVLLWFNPFIYWYEKATEQIHEYEADEKTSLSVGRTAYINLILEIVINKNNAGLAHYFAKNPLKSRIEMLFTNPSKRMKKLIYLVLVPICLIMFRLFAVEVTYAETLGSGHTTESKITKGADRGLTGAAKTVHPVNDKAVRLPRLKKEAIKVVEKKGDVKANDQTLAKMEYSARDSVSYSQDKKIINFYGQVKLTLDSLNFNADHIQINRHTNMLTAFKVKVTSSYGALELKGDTIQYDLKTKLVWPATL